MLILLQQLLKKSDILYFFTKKKFQKKNFVQKKSKNQNWPIFDFSLIGSSVFELEPKTAKLRKQVELCPQECFYLLTKDLFLFLIWKLPEVCTWWVIKDDSSGIRLVWWLPLMLVMAMAGCMLPRSNWDGVHIYIEQSFL